MEHDGALSEIAWPARQCRHVAFKLLDQALLVRGNDIHRHWLTADLLKSGYLIPKRKRAAPFRAALILPGVRS
jgi:hypothetical protein